MEYKINIKEEIFGGTVCIVSSGKRAYVSKEELKKILGETIFPKDMKDVETKRMHKKHQSGQLVQMLRFA